MPTPTLLEALRVARESEDLYAMPAWSRRSPTSALDSVSLAWRSPL
jgi:hypothetical protein